ncbi:glycosyl hydrolase family 18 protein [Cytobacillus praedii]|uniref:glycosyl hydrolase family 18 protein n=1 Tax=Cytobacillus praedii TaxID=1742358 RepID=UPI002E1B6409|nr:glycosyl hydrolase family 18 protein [Cytobacillus praedii]MED3573153.1 glycosyl hydrolase family 18 protein [Cytobacillus praedii]
MARVEYHKQKSYSMGWIIAGLLIAFLLIISSIILLLYPFASSEKEPYFQGENPILFEGKQAGNAIIENESVYMPYSFLKEHIDDSITFDEKSNSIILTTKNKVIQMPSESLTYYVNEEPVQLHFSVFKVSNGEKYIALDPILAYYPIEYSIMPETNAIWLKKDGEKIVHGHVTDKKINEEKLRLRTDSNLQSPFTVQAGKGDKLYIESEKEDYYFVRKENGIAGYLKKDFVVKEDLVEEVSITHEKEEIIVPKIDGPIHLTWEAVYTKNPDPGKMPKMPGVNVISPTWFELGDSSGAIKNLGSLDFTTWAGKQGYQVWGLFSNAFDPKLTHEAFKDFQTRQKIIRQLLHFSQIYHLNGINIDIENVNPEDGPLITQFVREAVPYFHEAGLVVSMDVTFIASGNWSAFYERDKLASLVDYMVVMAYDEHWGSSPVAGSVASLPWVEKNLQTLLEVVPNDRLILGVPLYARLWAEKDTGEVSSKALSMSKVQEWLTENGLTPVYDEASGQNYAELYIEAEQTTYKVWLEDELSLSKRADLAMKYDLAGVASWSRFFADESAWTALSLKEGQITKK